MVEYLKSPFNYTGTKFFELEEKLYNFVLDLDKNYFKISEERINGC